MKSTNVAVYRERPRARCCWCLGPAWSGTDTCRHCRGVASYSAITPTDADALTGGRWEQRGGVLVWHAEFDAIVDPPGDPR